MEKRIVIVGGGIHGVSIAYYLATRYHVKSTVIEATSLAAAASGKSGGFLARGWGDGPTCSLHEISFDMHAELAKELSLASYRQITTLEVDGNPRRRTAKATPKSMASWLNGDNVSSSLMDNATAQVTSLELVTRMWEEAQRVAGCELVLGRAVGLPRTPSTTDTTTFASVATGVHVMLPGESEPTLIPADVVILAMGPWSAVAVEDWCGFHLPMEGIKSTSLVFHQLPRLGIEEPYACFCAEDAVEHCHLEVYPRGNGDVYVCGIGGSDHVSGDRLRYPAGDCASADAIHANPSRVQAAYRALARLSSEFAVRCVEDVATGTGGAVTGADVLQACMRPCTSDALPVMGLVPDTTNVYLSTGHNCWGILWAPVSGLAMSELVMDGRAACVDLAPFDPRRLLQPTAQHEAERVAWQQAQQSSSNSSGPGRGRKRVDQAVGEQW
eukprot:gene13323-9545_t